MWTKDESDLTQLWVTSDYGQQLINVGTNLPFQAHEGRSWIWDEEGKVLIDARKPDKVGNWGRHCRQFREKGVINKKFRKQFYFSTCILPGYVGHESSKGFWTNSHFENMRADILRCQNLLRHSSPEMMHFQAWKEKIVTDIMSLLLIQLEFRHTNHLKILIWTVLWKLLLM